MYISELRMHGFKSFAKKEKLHFGDGITAIVGPNGCGKTNIVDAVRWVLGEQKYTMLRSKKMEDIIFNGSESRKPLGVCEVNLTVHNDKGKLPVDYTDVEITRRVFRNGESEYMINRAKCRLKDIHNLFVDTGMGADAYSVIELKMIEDILSENAEDRRRMFEEAAGINKYKHQRKSTLLKIEATTADINRVNDIIAEVDGKVNALKLQLKRYDRHAKLVDKLQQKEVERAFLQRQELNSALVPLVKSVTELTHQRSIGVEGEKIHESSLEQLRTTYKSEELELRSMQEKLNELSDARQSTNNRILVITEQVKSAERTIERLSVEKEELEEKIGAQKFSISELEVEMETFAPKIEDKERQYNARREEFDESDENYRRVEENLQRLSSHHIDHLRKLNDLRSLLERTQQTLEDKGEYLETLESDADEAESEKKTILQQQKKYLNQRKDLEQSVAAERKAIEQLDEEIQTLRSERHDLTLEFHKIANQVESLESQRQFYSEIIESKEGYPSGIRHVLNHLEDYPSVLGSVADLIEVDQKYRRALEASLGLKAKYLVCETRESAYTVLDDIRERKLGNVAIIPLDSVPPGPSRSGKAPAGKGIVAQACDVINTQKDVVPLIRFLFGDLTLVQDSGAAERLRKSKSFSGSIADLSGRYYENTGAISSVDVQEEVSILGRKEKLKELDATIDKLVKKGNIVQENVREADEKLSSSEDKHQAISGELSADIDALSEVERQITRNEYMISQTVDALKALTHQIVTTRHDILGLEKSLDKMTPQLHDLKTQEENYEGKIALARESLEQVKNRREEKNTAIQEVRFELVSLENEKETLSYRIEAAKDSIDEMEKKIVHLTEETSRLKEEMVQLDNDKSAEVKKLQKLNAQYKKVLSVKELKEEAFRGTFREIEKLEREIRDEQKERERLAEKVKRMELQVADYEGQIELIESRIREKYRSDLTEVTDVSGSIEDLTFEIDRIERSIERIGPINMAVKDEYGEESARLEFLQEQLADLLKSEASLMETMGRIDKAARDQFLETFGKIRDNFKGTFKLFFDGGESDLDLTGVDDPLEASISILAKPPGKHTKNLRMLSSGEKALTAISLLFAIYLVKPSPFCILDEVDAPLDDNNISKFTKVLQKFSEDTQFIIVTHNKLTMEAAKFLYGVTMAQSGVSNIVSVKFD
jgi:chromosome segregation protein